MSDLVRKMIGKIYLPMIVLSIFFLLPINMALAGGGCGGFNIIASTSIGQVQLSWTDIGIDHYNVYRSTISGGPYTYIGMTITSPYTDSTVAAGMTYYYVVRPSTATTEACQSNEVSATIPNEVSVPELGAPIAIIASISMIGLILLRKRFLLTS